MKKYYKIIFILVFSLFLFSGCGSRVNNTNNGNRPANLKEINGKVIEGLVEDGKVLIKKNYITDQALYVNYVLDDVQVGLITLKDSKGEIVVVVNTCQSCGGAPYAYFVQVGDKLQCQNCGSMFSIDELNDLSDDGDGCNPVPLDDMYLTDEYVVIDTSQLDNLTDKFQNWLGPKV